MSADAPLVRVLIADHQPLLRTGFRMVLGAERDLDIVGEASDGVEAVDLARRLLPDVVLMDIRLPRLDGVAATREIVSARLPVRVLVLTALELGDERVVDALRAGASGFLAKDVAAGELIAGIRTVAAGEAVMAPPILRWLLDRFAALLPDPIPEPRGLEVLTDREREVLVHIARGESNGEIARALSVSETTVKTHVGNVLTKLRLRDRVQAVVLAYESGLVRPRS